MREGVSGRLLPRAEAEAEPDPYGLGVERAREGLGADAADADLRFIAPLALRSSGDAFARFPVRLEDGRACHSARS